ncbi:hypothetical protein PVAND_004560 [Polypedilum vanderplanki]|uniref:trypsin n=1 Tax=Polypedilum vanderplanki TaxID=319348 RepID=A0A9J6BZG7_POLVA|nr:hypothetical protein PVAND_004560 [Polypedilum vanderplanki]
MRSLWLILIFVLSALISKCNSREARAISGRIVGGVEVDIEKIPYQVSLLYYDSLACGASILSCKFVLTAAHCFRGVLIVSSYTVRAGSSTFFEGGSIHDVSKIDIHPQYNRTLLDYDAAILTLRNLIKYDATRQAIQLPFLNEVIPEGTAVITSGWGLTQNFNESSYVLRMVELKVTNQAQCNIIFLGDGGITTRMLCAGADGKDSCEGDSGGPLQHAVSKKLVGIVSFGQSGGCAQKGIPGVYTRVAAIRTWIREIVEI